MISKLSFDQKFKIVMMHVFSKTLICRSMEVATQIARTQNLDCITLDGESMPQACLGSIYTEFSCGFLGNSMCRTGSFTQSVNY